MSPEDLQEGYYWIYREFNSWSNILRRMPTALTQQPRFLAFNIGPKKMNSFWDFLIQRNWLARFFRGYHLLDRRLWQFERWSQERRLDHFMTQQGKEKAKKDGDPSRPVGELHRRTSN